MNITPVVLCESAGPIYFDIGANEYYNSIFILVVLISQYGFFLTTLVGTIGLKVIGQRNNDYWFEL